MTTDLDHFATRLRAFLDAATRAIGEGEFDRLALELFSLQFAHNAAYRQLCEARRVAPDHIAHWTQIPAAPTGAFREFEFTSLPAAARTTVFHSSGTTGRRPSRHYHSAASLAIYEASLWPWFRAHLLSDARLPLRDLRVAILTPPPAQAPQSSLVHMLEVVRREVGAENSAFVGRAGSDGAWSLDLSAACETLRAACDARTPLALLGTAFLFVHLLDHLAENELRFALPPGSRVMETGGYKGRSRRLPKTELHALITRRLGVPASRIVCEYGMSELSSQAYDHALDTTRPAPSATRVFRFPPWARAQVISPETGREVEAGGTGLLRVFDLANVYSVLAIQAEDLGVRRGDGFELIGRAAAVEPRGCSLMTT